MRVKRIGDFPSSPSSTPSRLSDDVQHGPATLQGFIGFWRKATSVHVTRQTDRRRVVPAKAPAPNVLRLRCRADGPESTHAHRRRPRGAPTQQYIAPHVCARTRCLTLGGAPKLSSVSTAHYVAPPLCVCVCVLWVSELARARADLSEAEHGQDVCGQVESQETHASERQEMQRVGSDVKPNAPGISALVLWPRANAHACATQERDGCHAALGSHSAHAAHLRNRMRRDS